MDIRNLLKHMVVIVIIICCASNGELRCDAGSHEAPDGAGT